MLKKVGAGLFFMDIRNIAIIAHVDHGKTTLVPVQRLPFARATSSPHGGACTGLRFIDL